MKRKKGKLRHTIIYFFEKVLPLKKIKIVYLISQIVVKISSRAKLVNIALLYFHNSADIAVHLRPIIIQIKC